MTLDTSQQQDIQSGDELSLLRARVADLERQLAERDERLLQADGRYQAAQHTAQQLTRQVDQSTVMVDAIEAFLRSGLQLEPLLESICRRVAETIGDGCAIWLLSADGAMFELGASYHPNPEVREFLQALVAAASRQIGEGLNSHVVRTGEPILLASFPSKQAQPNVRSEYWPYVERFGAHTAVVVPLRASGRVLGTLTAVRDATPEAYVGDDQVFLQDLADRAALILHNVRLYVAEQQAHRAANLAGERIARLQEVTAALLAALTPEDIAQIVVVQAVTALGAAAGTVMLCDDEHDELRLLAAHGYDPELVKRQRRIPFSIPTPLGEAARTGRIIVTIDTDDLVARYPQLAKLPLQDYGARVALPLRAGPQVVGAFGLSFAEARTFDTAEQEFMIALAGQCALALERARLYTREQRSAFRLASLHAIDQAVLEARPIDEIVETALKIMRRVVPNQRAAVLVFGFRADKQQVIAAYQMDGDRFQVSGAQDAQEWIAAFRAPIERYVEDIAAIEERTPQLERLYQSGVR
ncbi:MAG TPA: GAF domain-containing protein, partial [Roseiflexaceae bacterium]|nr:GAF domain-containing protein [Roseiflexaceae bacterium]